MCRGPQRAVGLRRKCNGLGTNEGEVRVAEKKGAGGKSRGQGDLLGQPWGTCRLRTRSPGGDRGGRRGPGRGRAGPGGRAHRGSLARRTSPERSVFRALSRALGTCSQHARPGPPSGSTSQRDLCWRNRLHSNRRCLLEAAWSSPTVVSGGHASLCVPGRCP